MEAIYLDDEQVCSRFEEGKEVRISTGFGVLLNVGDVVTAVLNGSKETKGKKMFAKILGFSPSSAEGIGGTAIFVRASLQQEILNHKK